MKNAKAVIGVILVAIAGVFMLWVSISAANSINTKVIATADAQSVTTLQIRTGSNVHWSGSILDGSFDSTSYEGQGNKDFTLDCSGAMGIYSLVIQNMGENGVLTLNVVQDGSVIDTGTTSAAFGLVMLSGNC